MAYPPGVRASDDDRNRVVDTLANAFSDGQLTEPEYDERSKAALQAPTLAELGVLTRDLQTQPQLTGVAPQTSTLPLTHTLGSGRRMPWRAVAGVAAPVIVIAAAVLVFRAATGGDDTTAPPPRPTKTTLVHSGPAQGRIPPVVIPGPPDMFSEPGLIQFVSSMSREAGTTVVTSLNIQPTAASFDVRRPGDPGVYSYYYDGFIGVPSHSDTSSDDSRLDLKTVDAAAVAREMRTLPSRLGIANPTTRYITLDFDQDGGKNLTLYVSGADRTGWETISPDGRVLHLQRP